MNDSLTRRQREIYAYLREQAEHFDHPPSLDALCQALGLKSRGSLHKQISALVAAGLVEPLDHKHRGIRLSRPEREPGDALPLLGTIAAGHPIEAIEDPELIDVPPQLRTRGHCYVLRVRGDSMIDEGIFDGDWVIIEQRDCAKNGEIVVALIDEAEATLKRIEQHPGRVVLHPANPRLKPMVYEPQRVRIQGVVVGQMRRYA